MPRIPLLLAAVALQWQYAAPAALSQPQSEASAVKWQSVYCDDCGDVVNDLIKHCEKEGTAKTFCQAQGEADTTQCDFLIQQMTWKVFCPHDPCAQVRASVSSMKGNPQNLCQHPDISCKVKPKPTQPPKPALLPPKEITCKSCSSVVAASKRWCGDNDWNLENFSYPGAGLCASQFPNEVYTCEAVARQLGKVYAPEQVCWGMKCVDKTADVCNEPPFSCGPGKPNKEKKPADHQHQRLIAVHGDEVMEYA